MVSLCPCSTTHDISGLVQDWNNTSALAVELLQSYAKPSISCDVEPRYNGTWLYYAFCVPLVSYSMWIFIPPETKFRGGILDSPCSSVCLSVCLSVRPSVRLWVGVRMITLILFSGFKIFFYIYHLGQDLAGDWISASYLIKYAHTGRSCDLLIFGIPEVNFLVRAFQFSMKGVLSRIYDISPGFCWIPIFVFFLNFLRVS